MKAAAIRACKIPIEAPRDLIEEFFEAKKRALREALDHITYSLTGEAHLKFGAYDRRELRNGLLGDWRYLKHYIDSAINSVIGLEGMDETVRSRQGEIKAKDSKEDSLYQEHVVQL